MTADLLNVAQNIEKGLTISNCDELDIVNKNLEHLNNFNVPLCSKQVYAPASFFLH